MANKVVVPHKRGVDYWNYITCVVFCYIFFYGCHILNVGENMKKIISLIFCGILGLIICVGCKTNEKVKTIELMGAGDRIHDSYTFANTGVKISDEKNVYTIYGSVEKLDDGEVKKEFDIADDVTHVVAIKLSAVDEDVDKNEVQIKVDGVRNYDAEHLNGSSYTYIILEAVPDETVTITVSWNKNSEEKTYIVYFSADLSLK